VSAVAEVKGVSLLEAQMLLLSAQGTLAGLTSISSAVKSLGIEDEVFSKHQGFFLNPELHISRDDELVGLLRGLRLQFKIALHTNTRRDFVGRVLQAIGLTTADFDLVVAGGDGLDPKPSRSSLERILTELSVNANNCYAVGDRWLVDLQPAVDLGIKPVHVKSRDELVNWLKSIITP
jgi:FMN phosphatase YigB (HAD superfamily)